MGPLGRCLMESGASNPGVAIVTRPAVDRPRADPVAPATSCRIRTPLPDLSESSVFGPMTHPFDLPPRREASAGGILSPERPQRPRSPSHRDRVGTFFEATRLINADAPLAWPRGALPLRARFQAAPFTRAGNQFLRPRGIGVPPFACAKENTMFAATTTSIVRPIGVLLGGTGRRRQVPSSTRAPGALLRRWPWQPRHTPQRGFANACTEVGRHD